MKTIVTITIALFVSSTLYSQVQSVYVETAGTLETIMADITINSSQVFYINGNLNGSDVKFLRKLLGNTFIYEDEDNDSSPETRIIKKLDLENANIVAGGDAYFCQVYSSKPLEETLLYTENDSIGELMFAYCENLEYLVLPKTTKHIGHYAFINTGNFDILRTTIIVPPTCEEDSFSGIEKITLVVPNGYKDTYLDQGVWSKFGNIIEEEEYLAINETVKSAKSDSSVYSISGIKIGSINHSQFSRSGVYITSGKKHALK